MSVWNDGGGGRGSKVPLSRNVEREFANIGLLKGQGVCGGGGSETRLEHLFRALYTQ